MLGAKTLGGNLAELLDAPHVIESVDAVLAGKPAKRDTVHIPLPVARTYEKSVWELSPRAPGKASWAMLVLHDVTAAGKADKMRADFISNVSHELRSPLSSLVSFIETLRGPAKDDAEARERFLGLMEGEARRMTHLINDLLTLSKVESYEHIRPEGSVDLHQVLKQVSAVLSLRAKKRGITITISCPPGLPKINGNEDELMQVFRNLIDNAVNYGLKGKPILVAIKKVDKIPGSDEKGVAVFIENQGEGISPEHIDRLTERFYRVDKGRSRNMGGTGLGLAIVKHILNHHRGRLTIASTPGKTTTFTVYLPRRLSAAE
ncbi:MAG: hypothetical protein A3H92_02035 [Rhodospirillales bacterium RIFCSPLOWO2_02_FULL_58_16]|nr:MAG: hypothetical protein A3H92_02035 [Rhodospirillales bacterium RIFCSPLOWO2_02_FULL_58_16]